MISSYGVHRCQSIWSIWRISSIDSDKPTLKYRPRKACGRNRTVKFLGFIINSQGHRPCPTRLRALQSLQAPTTPKQLKSVLGMFAYNRKYILNFGGHSKILYSLLKKDTKWHWTEAHEKAFQTLKEKLLNPLTLSHPDYTQPFSLFVDASTSALAFALCQGQPGEERLTPTQSAYAITTLELLSVIFGLKQSAPFLGPTQAVTVYTDHINLLFLKKNKAQRGMMLRLILQLQEYDNIVIKHLPGRFNVISDFLSRVPKQDTHDDTDFLEVPAFNETVAILQSEEETPPTTSDYKLPESTGTRTEVPDSEQIGTESLQNLLLLYPPSMAELDSQHVIQQLPSLQEIQDAQRQDGSLKPLIAYLESQELPAADEQARKIIFRCEQFMLNGDGLLLHFYTNRRSKHSSMEKFHVQVVIPEIFEKQFLIAFHDESIHAGKNKLFCQLREDYYFDKMFQKCENHVKHCHECQTAKDITIHTHVQSTPLPIAGIPFTDLTFDTVGPLSISEDAHRYILSVQCNNTRYVLLFPIRNQDAKTIVDILYHRVFCIFSFPSVIRSDRGSPMMADVTKALFNTFGIKHVVSSPYTPHAQGRLERLHKLLGATLRLYPENERQRWPDLLSSINYGMNCAPRQELANFSPAELLLWSEISAPGFDCANTGQSKFT